MIVPRFGHAATVLNNESVLVSGGSDDAGQTIGKTEVYDPLTGHWTKVCKMNITRYFHTSSLLLNGKVLATGGTQDGDSGIQYAELYDPITQNWTLTNSMYDARTSHTASILRNGKVLVTGGGTTSQEEQFDTCELYRFINRDLVTN